jgi:hypothetical protein
VNMEVRWWKWGFTATPRFEYTCGDNNLLSEQLPQRHVGPRRMRSSRGA